MADDEQKGRDKQSMGSRRSLSPYNLTYGIEGMGIVRGTGADWFGPLNPMHPTAPPDVRGRIFDFQSGYNLNLKPKTETVNGNAYNSITFDMLRAFSDAYDLLRLVIETRKDQMSRMKWNVAVREDLKVDKTKYEERIKDIKKFFLRPDKVHFWGDWLRLLLEDLLVLDAPSLFVRRTYGGDLYSLEPLDGGTIKRVIDDWGRTPLPPTAAYQQVLKGYPAVDYTSEQLIYKPRNVRTHRVYGFSPVEQIIMTINIGLRRQTWQLETFTEGNMPEALIGTPSSWTPDQIASFQNWFDSMLQGNTAERSRAKFVPGEVGKSFIEPNRGELFGEAEEWLARVVCFAFSISPQPFLKMMNRATAETAQETAASEGLAPMMGWVKSLMDGLILDLWGDEDLEFIWQDEDELDPKTKSEILDRDSSSGLITINQARKDMGLEPYPEPEFDRPMFKGVTGWTPIALTPDEKAQKEAAAAAMAEAMGVEPPPGSEDGEEDPDKVPPGGGAPPPGGAVPPKPAARPEVAEKSDRPFELEKAGKTSSSDDFANGGVNADREFAAKRERGIKALFQATFRKLAKQVAKDLEAALPGVEKADKPEIDIDGIIDDLDLALLLTDEEDLAEFLEEIYGDSGRIALSSFGSQSAVGDLVDQVYDRAVIWANDRAASLVGKGPDGVSEIEDSTRKMLRGTIAKGLADNVGTPNIAKLIRDSYAFSEERAELIAFTEVTSANSEGALEGYRKAAEIGVKMGKSWLVLEDACVICDGNADAGIIELDEPFPSGDMAPGAHPNCRCVLVPEVLEAEKMWKSAGKQPREPAGTSKGGQFASTGGYDGNVELGDPVPAPPMSSFRQLTDGEKDSSLLYREENVAVSLNNKLRKGEQLTPEEAKLDKDLRNVALSHRFSEEVTLYRGVAGKSVEDWEKQVGKTVTLSNGYASTTTSKNVSDFYAGERGGLVLVISGSKGKSAFSFGKEFGAEAEGEVLLRPGRKIKVNSVNPTTKEVDVTWVK